MNAPASEPGSGRAPADREVPTAEQPAEHALLGLLVLSGGTAHGYDLARQFRRGKPLGDVIRLESAMLYQHLKKLDRLGWLTMTIAHQPPRPPRQVCRITAAGEAELQRWLAEPVAHTREIRLEFLVKLYFARQLDPAQAWRLANEQLRVMQQLAHSLEGQLIQDIAQDDDAAFARTVLALRLKQTHAAQEWLTDVVELFRPQNEQTAR